MKVSIMFILMILFFLTIETNAQSIPKVTAPEYGWPVSELPVGFPVLDTGQINEVMTKTNKWGQNHYNHFLQGGRKRF